MRKTSPKQIAEAIYKAAEGKSKADVEVILKRAVAILGRKGILSRSEEIIGRLQNILDKKEGVVRARIFSSKKLPSEEKNKLEKEIKERYGAEKVVSQFFENEELLGGVRFEVGDEVLDATYRSKLRKLEKFLTEPK